MWTRLRANVSRLLFALARRRLDEDTRLEIDAHLDLLTERYVRQGLSPDEAYITARRRFGNATLMRQDVHELNSFGWIEQGVQDLRYALRQLRRSPGFAAVVVATLGLGIGGATAVFSVVQAVLLAPLPYEEPGHLVRFYQQDPDKPDTRDVLAGTHFTFLRDHATAFEEVAAIANYTERGLDLFAEGRPQRLLVLRVSSGYFGVLRAHPRLGRDFDRSDETGTKRVVLSDAAWRSYFGGDPALVGKSIRLSGELYEVAGVAAADFEDPFAPDVAAWIPYPLASDTYEENNSLAAVGRLRNGVHLAQARADLATLTRPMRERWPAAKQSAIIAISLHEQLVARARGPLQLVFAAVALVLLVACVNVANLLLARAAARQREVAVRASLGAGRWRLVRQHLTESLVLALVGGACGLLVGRWAGVLLAAAVFGPEADIASSAAAPGARVVVFAAAVSLATAVVFGLAPALNAARLDLAAAMAAGGRGSSQAHMRGMRPLVAAQLALSFVVVVAATLFGRSLLNYLQLDPGFDTERVVAVAIDPLASGYQRDDLAALNQRLVDIASRTPGVVSAAVAGCGLMDGCRSASDYVIEGYQPRPGETVLLQENFVGLGYFETVGMPLVEGRGFERADFASEAPVGVINESAARRYFGGRSAIGRRLGYDDVADTRIVGVVRDARVNDLQTSPEPMIFMPQRFPAVVAQSLNVRVTGDPGRAAAAVRAALERAEPALVITRVTALQEHVDRSVADERLVAYLTSSFAVLALVLAAIGLYGVLSYSVARRTQEFGVRAALGAAPGDVARLIVADGALVVAGGLAAGAGSALLAGRLIASLLFGVSAADPATYAAVAAVLAVTALLACYVPARRASRVDPSLALRAD